MIGVLNAATEPLWNVDNPERVERSSLDGYTDADVAIVGAGFTGLWSAYYLLKANPNTRIVIVEAAHVGYGASGRNGGWCSAISPIPVHRLAEMHGPSVAQRWQEDLLQTVRDIGSFTTENHVDAHYQRDGWLCVARNRAQEQRLRAEISAWAAAGLNGADMRWLAPSAEHNVEHNDEQSHYPGVPRIDNVRGALFTPHCAAINPARLVHGLARVVESMGARIVEQTAATSIASATSTRAAQVHTTHGTVRASTVIRALEGFTSTLDPKTRDILPIYSLMIATEPLPDDVFEHLGWTTRATLNDARNIVIYAQRTKDNRIAFGGRGAPYHFRSAVKPAFDVDDRVHAALANTLTELWPSLSGVAVTHRWGGPLGITRNWKPFARHDRATGIASAGGYVGDGVTVSAVAGKTLASLISTGRVDAHHNWWVNQPPVHWEPEPLRWIGVTLGMTLPEMIDEAEHGGGSAPKRSRLLAKLTGG